MDSYKASLDYWSQAYSRPKAASVATELGADGVREIISLEASKDIEFSRVGQYDYDHPRFKWFLLTSALFIPLVIFTGFEIATSHPPQVQSTLMTSTGARTMTAQELVSYITVQNKLAYWIKPLAGNTYSNNSTLDGVDSVSYIPDGTNLTDLTQVSLTIKTYRNSAAYANQLEPLVGPHEMTQDLGNGKIIAYDLMAPTRMLVTFKDRPEIVEVVYPGVEDVGTLLRDAGNLSVIR